MFLFPACGCACLLWFFAVVGSRRRRSDPEAQGRLNRLRFCAAAAAGSAGPGVPELWTGRRGQIIEGLPNFWPGSRCRIGGLFWCPKRSGAAPPGAPFRVARGVWGPVTGPGFFGSGSLPCWSPQCGRSVLCLNYDILLDYDNDYLVALLTNSYRNCYLVALLSSHY